MTTSDDYNWNVPKLTTQIKNISHLDFPTAEVSWSDAEGNVLSRKNNPKHLTVITRDHRGMLDRIQKLPGCIKVTKLGEICSEGPSAFVIIRDDKPALIHAVFTRHTVWQ